MLAALADGRSGGPAARRAPSHARGRRPAEDDVDADHRARRPLVPAARLSRCSHSRVRRRCARPASPAAGGLGARPDRRRRPVSRRRRWRPTTSRSSTPAPPGVRRQESGRGIGRRRRAMTAPRRSACATGPPVDRAGVRADPAADAAATPPPPPADPSTAEQAPAWGVDTGAAQDPPVQGPRHRRRRGRRHRRSRRRRSWPSPAAAAAAKPAAAHRCDHRRSRGDAAFPGRSFPELGVTENRTWTVSGGKHPTLHGTLVFHTTKNVLAQINEHAAQVARVERQPGDLQAAAEGHQGRPGRAVHPADAGGSDRHRDLRHPDLRIPTSPWARCSAGRPSRSPRPATPTARRTPSQSMSIPAQRGLRAGRVAGRSCNSSASSPNGTPAPSVAFGGATFNSANPAVATVSKTGAVTGVSAGHDDRGGEARQPHGRRLR